MPDQWNAFVVGPRAFADRDAPTPDNGDLAGLTFAVKDVIDVAGLPTGRGLAGHPEPATRSAAAVDRLLAAGAVCVGKTTTDQLAFGLSGLDTGTPAPVNPRDPAAMAGGSSSGSAAAVAAGLVAFALATDTAGSARVPASYCGVTGFRPTHGAVPSTGVSPLAPRFDTVGWIAQDVRTARAVGRCLLPPREADPGATGARPTRVLLLDDVLAELTPSLAGWVTAEAARIAAAWEVPVEHATLGTSLGALGDDFRTQQLVEVAHHLGATPPDDVLAPVRDRLAGAAQARQADADSARERCAEVLGPLLDRLAEGAVIALPAAAGPAPARDADGTEEYAAHRRTTIALGAIAGLLGAPSLALPTASGVAVALVSAPGSDLALLDAGCTLEPDSCTNDLDTFRAAFYAYERALVEGDGDALSRAFGADAAVTRIAPEGVGYGRAEIDAARRRRPSAATPRHIDHLVLRLLGPRTAVTAVAFTRSPTGVRGHQTQTWQREEGGWRIQLAHVSLTVDPPGSRITAAPVPSR
ncbi:DUF3225 domain-containing protein [Cellulomonas sp. JH27-2]|uniref:AtzH-like domain-containing protein n=1 Tax=Cellulomonas sp. JH27-2 TaxID=2774139 RepID=UPI00177AD428|nr:AtzH-like domain-containing protein [Cellulomonas sp. JH27-2]MBD8058918.1 DUF3225 domain-containing protein [Cellulomonas sp. JH27-2]